MKTWAALLLLLALCAATAFSFHHECQHDSRPKVEPVVASQNYRAKRDGEAGEAPIRIVLDYRFMQFTDNNKVNLLKNQLLPAALTWISAALSVKPVVGNLFLNKFCQVTDGQGNCIQYRDPTPCQDVASVPAEHLAQTVGATGIANADYILYITSLATTGNTLAYAGACQDDQNGRPIAGAANFDETKLKVAATGSFDFDNQVALVIHEIFHALGFSSSYFTRFKDENGNPRTGVVKTFNERGLTVSKITTPNVLREAAAQYNCAGLNGMEIEQQGGQGTAGSHWEQRIVGNELMGGALFPNVIAKSRITLALLADSGWYVVNYNAADTMYWGKNKGCNFATAKCLTPGATPTSIDPETFCTTKDEVSCSPGRTARGICLVADFNAPLDAAFQYFTNNPNRGGTSSLTDFCPLYVTLNYNDKLGVCNYAESQPNANQNFFGETFGTSSRCFTSTLVGQNFQGVTVLGAGCYPQRCNNGVLEIQINNNFVPCPVAGGKITAAGFTGDLTCPPAASMCDVPAGTSPSSSPSQLSASSSPSTGSSVSPSTSRPGSASSTSAPSVTPSNTLPPSASSSPGSAPSPSSSPAPPSSPPSRSSAPSAPPSTSPAPSFVPKPSSVPPPAPPPTCDVDPLKKLQDLKALCEPGDVCSTACTAAIADFKTSTKNCCTPGLTDEIITTFTLIDNRCKRTCTKTDFAAKWASTYTACSNATLGNCPATCAQRVTAFAEEFRVCFGIIVTQPLPVNPAPLTDEYALLFVRSQLSSIQALCAASSVAQCTKDNILPVSLWARSVCERDGCAAASCANASRLLDATKDDCFGPNGVPDAWKAYLADSCTNPFPCVVQLRAAALDVKLACVALSTGNCTAACQDARTKYETLASKCGCGKPVDPFVSLERDSKGSCRGCGSAVADALKAARAGCVADGTCSDNCRVLVQAARVAIGRCYFDAPAPRALMDQFDSLNDFCERPRQPTCRLSVSEAQAALQECSLGICTQACRDAAKDFRAVVKTCFNDSVPPSTFNAWRRVLGVCGGNSIARVTVTSPQGPAGAVLKLVFNSIVRALQVTDASVVALVNYQPGASGATIDVQVPTNLVDTLVTLATSNRIPPLNVSGASKLPNDVDSSVLTLSAFYNATACSALNQVDVMQQLRELCTDSCDSICQDALTRARSIFSTCCVPGVTEDIKTAIVSIDLRCRFSATCTKVQVIDATHKVFTACKSSKYGACTTECSQAVQTYSNFVKGCYNVDDTAPVTTPAGQIAQDDILNLAKNVVSNIRNLCTAAPVTCTKDDILPVVLSSRVICETFGVCSVPCKQMILKVKDSINDCFQSSQAPNTLKDFANDECPDISDKTCLNQLNDASFDVKTACGSAQTCSDACKTARQNFENLIRRCTCGRPEDAQADSLSQSQASCLACVPDVETAFTNAVVTCRTAGKCTTACQTAIQNAKTKTEACFTTNIPKGYTSRLAVLQTSFCGNNEKTCTLDVSDKLAAAQQCGDGICTPACQSALLELREAVRTCYAPGTVPDTINTEWRRLRATCGNVAIRKYSVKTSVNFNDATARNNWLKLFRATLASVSGKTEDFFAFVSATPVTNLKRENGIEVNIQGDPATIAAATGNGIPSLTSSQLQTNAVAATPDGLTGESTTTTTTTTTTTANTAAPGLTVINLSFADLIR